MLKPYAAAGVLAAMLSASAVQAQQQIEWRQTLNTPKGLNLPREVKGDILGIELGDTYAELKPKLQKLLAEATNAQKPKGSDDDAIGETMGERSGGPLEERVTQFRFAAPGGHVTASFIGGIVLTRKMKGSTQQTIHDALDIKMSAPSSGQQVLGVKRSLMYLAQSDQPRVSELFAALKQKYRAEPQRVDDYTYRFIFDNGRSYVPPRVDPAGGCQVQYDLQGQLNDIVSLANRTGECDVVLQVQIQFGISKDHARAVTFILSDNERTRLNLSGDIAFFNSYVRDLQSRAKGAAPKL